MEQDASAARSAGCLAKLDRMNKTLRHEEADRVPDQRFLLGQLPGALAAASWACRPTPTSTSTTTWTGS